MKKIFALMIATVMMLSSVVIPSYAADEVELKLTARENGLLYALGITNNADPTKIYATNNATRGTVAYYVARMVNEDNSVSSAFEAIYYDVTSEHQYYREIKELKNAGIMNGYPNGKFGPSDSVSSMEMSLIMARVFGYAPYVSAMGINAYVQKTKILEGVGVKEQLQIQDVLRIIYNALHAPAMEISGISNNGADYDIDEKNLGLDYLYNIIYAKGIVNGTNNTRLAFPDTAITTKDILIDDARYVYDKGDSTDFLGYFSEFYYVEKNGRNEIIYIAKSDRNRELVLESDILEDFTSGTFTYADLKNNKYKTVEVADDIDVILNGIANPAYEDAEMVPSMGAVTLIDNNNDKKYDVVKIDSYEFYLVNNVDVNNRIIYDQTKGVKLDLKNVDDYRITWDGDDYSLDRLVNGSFIIVKRTNPVSGFYYADIEVRKDERSYTEIEKVDLKNNYIRGGGSGYTLWNNLSEESKQNLENGAWVTLYFCNDVVVRVEKSEAGGSGKFGYLTSIAKEGVFDTQIRFMIANSSGELAEYTSGKVLKIDESGYKSFDEVESKLRQSATLSGYYNAEFPYAQPIKYELNEEGNILKIDTLFYDGDKESFEDSLRLAFSGRYDYQYGNLYDTSGTTMMATDVASTVKMKVPAQDRFDEYGYSAGGLYEGDAANVEVYNCDAISYIAGAIYVYKDSTTSSMTRRIKPIIVKELTVEADDEGDVIYTVVCFDQKQEVKYSGSQKLVGNVDTGDVIRITLDKDNQISELEVLFDASEGTPAKSDRMKYFTTNSPGEFPMLAGYKIVYALALFREGSLIRATMSLPSDEDFDPESRPDNFSAGSAAIYKYSNVRGNELVELGSLSDIKTYAESPDSPSELIVYTYNSAIQFIYIIEK